MKRIFLVIGILLLAVSFAFAAGPKSYQVTGPVLEVTKDKIAVQKGKDKWEIALDPAKPVPAGLKVGDKVTIEYTMTATDIKVKDAGKKDDKKKK
jgi:hypothetical protein